MDYSSLPQGVDVSHWNGVVDWSGLAAAGVVFCYIKATQGLGTDVRYASNVAGARAAGILALPYVFLTAEDDAATVSHFLDVAGDGPVVLDREPPGEIPVSVVELWVRQLPRVPLIYQGLSDDWTPVLAQCPRILPEYAAEPKLPPWDGGVLVDWSKEWLIWQRSEKGTFRGEVGNFDLDVLAVPLERFKVWVETGSWG